MDGPTLIQAGGRRLLSDCTVVGSVGVGGSIAILLLIGFVVGAASSAVFFWWRQRRAMRIELGYRSRYGDAARAGALPDVNAMVRAATTPTIARGGFRDSGDQLTSGGGGGAALSKAASAMGEGPLAMGVCSKGGLKAHSNPVALGAAAVGSSSSRSSDGNPFSDAVPLFNVRKNEVCSLNNTPSPRPHQSQELIGTGVFAGAPAADPASPRITKPAAASAASVAPGASVSASQGGPFAWATQSMDASASPQMGGPPAAGGAATQHARSATVVVNGGGGGAGAAGAAGLPRSGHSGHYLAALDSTATNPFETPAAQQAAQQQQQAQHAAAAAAQHAAAHAAEQAAAAAAAAKAAHKAELLQAVGGDEYGDGELDPEWNQLLGELDGRLQAAGRPRLSARERAVAIRSLIVATASQSADVALNKATHDVEAFRRAASFRGAGAAPPGGAA